jgi:hypothetical protein
VTTRSGENRADAPAFELLRRGLSEGACLGPGGRFSARLMLAELDGRFERLRGRRAPIVGRVCMDQIMIDVTDVPGVAIGDEVELWGRELPVEEVAAIAGTIPYELLTRIGARVPRVAV